MQRQSDDKGTEPLAISTPRKAKSAVHNSRYTSYPFSQGPFSTSEKPDRITDSSVTFATKELVSSQPRAVGSRITDSDCELSIYQSPGNLRYSSLQQDKSLPDQSKLPTTSVSSAIGAVSRTKEIVKINNRNSNELDPSKCFKPIDPNDEMISADSSTLPKPKPLSTYRSSSYLTNSKPAPITATHRYYPASTASTKSYDRPYRSTYESSTYKPRYGQMEDYKNVSADSAYGSPSRSLSKAPSVTSYTSPYHHRDSVLPSMLSSRTQYSTAANHEAKDSLTKVPPLFTSQHLITA